MKRLTLGILAHVDAGKTTLSEQLLYHAGAIRKAGRVDNADAFLDTYELEKKRGITIFSKQALFQTGDISVTLIDTPGHIDFSPEMERTLPVLSAAILLISAADGVNGYTMTLFRLLEHYRIPAIIFVNKMDQPGADQAALMKEIRSRLGGSCVDYTNPSSRETMEDTAVLDERVMEHYLAGEVITDAQIRSLISERKLIPCLFGSALKGEGVDALLGAIRNWLETAPYPDKFGARVYKTAFDEQGTRLTFLKINGGRLRVKDVITYKDGKTEKADQIRLYNGSRYELLQEVEAGMVCAVAGLSSARPGMGLGAEPDGEDPVLEPVMSYELILPEGTDRGRFRQQLSMLEEEEPLLQAVQDPQTGSIYVHLMGEIQTEILESLIRSRFGTEVSFGPGRIQYKETIENRVEGVGHYEPLRHYAEVHFLLEPGEPGSGMVYRSICRRDDLSQNWQNLILTHLMERPQRGVLIGAPLTDVRITLVSGRASEKHTEGGDFREAVYRAV